MSTRKRESPAKMRRFRNVVLFVIGFELGALLWIHGAHVAFTL